MTIPRTLVQPLQSLTIGGVHRFATCFEITRTDATVFRFTDHDVPLVVDGETYSPAGGPAASARESEEGLTPQNLEAFGFLDDDSITANDLIAGRFRAATVIEFTVDWMYPWLGKYDERHYDVRETVHSAETWRAECEGLRTRLRQIVGWTYELDCRWRKLGDENCTVNLAALTVTAEVVGITTSRKVFTTTIPTGNEDNYYEDGELTWTSGLNAGLVSEVKSYVEEDGLLTLYLATPFDIAATDEFTLTPGCDRQFETCKNKFDNVLNFGGHPDIPGNDDLHTTPDAKA